MDGFFGEVSRSTVWKGSEGAPVVGEPSFEALHAP